MFGMTAILSMTISFRSWSESCLSTVNEFLTACAGCGRELVTLEAAGKLHHEASEG
jgi:hypothetical protein